MAEPSAANPSARRGPVWGRAAEMFLLGGTTKDRADIQEAARQLLTAEILEPW